MIELANTKYGTKRKAIIGGVSFKVAFNTIDVSFIVKLMDNSGNPLDDLSLRQNREVIYTLNNGTRVDSNFNIVQTGGKGEYEYFMELMQTIPLPTLILQLGSKINERGIFD